MLLMEKNHKLKTLCKCTFKGIVQRKPRTKLGRKWYQSKGWGAGHSFLNFKGPRFWILPKSFAAT
jgi:hypothetical protein